MGVSICLRRFAVSRPAGMTYATSAGERFSVVCLFSKVSESAYCLNYFRCLFAVTDSKTG